jgi:hypothetical protein
MYALNDTYNHFRHGSTSSAGPILGKFAGGANLRAIFRFSEPARNAP